MGKVVDIVLAKKKNWRCKPYLESIRLRPCVSCGIHAPSHPHHISLPGLTGIGTKAPDSTVIPLCTICHAAAHRGSLSYQDQLEMLVILLMKSLEERYDGPG